MAGRYALFQVPGWIVAAAVALAAVRWGGAAPWMGWLGLALWVLKDLALFPIVRGSYEPGGPGHGHVGEAGVALDAIADEGWVRVGAELWRARLAPGARPVARGEALRVVALEGSVLRIEAQGPGDPAGASAHSSGPQA